MSDPAESGPPNPTVDAANLREIAPGVFVIPDRRVPLVPNIGIIVGRDAALVVDCGMGPANGATVLEAARRVAGGRQLLLTITHFHPEHGFGAQAFRPEAAIIYNRAQRDDLRAKGQPYLDMFRGFHAGTAAALDGTVLVDPHAVYDGASAEIDLGGRRVELRTFGRAHTNGDQIIWLPEERILFTGDLAEERIFPIFPWFPPEDMDIDGANWAAVLQACADLNPATVVPGHGDVGGAEILAAVRGYMLALAASVAKLRRDGQDADAIVAALEPGVRAQYPGWESPEWIGFAIRYYASLG